MEIKINNKLVFTDCTTLGTLRSDYAPPKDCITILNGFALAQDSPLTPHDEVFFIDKHTLPPQEALEAMMCARHTPHVHQKVKQGRVAIAGLGGLGSHVAIMLARTGVGQLHLIDFDTVDASNLNRQAYKIKDLGHYKATSLAAELKEINPFITVKTDIVRVSQENIGTLFADDYIVCESFDNPQAKALLINGITEQYPEKYIIGASGMAGYGDSNRIITRRITDRFYLCGDGDSAAKPGRGLMAPRVNICAGHEANLILELLIKTNN